MGSNRNANVTMDYLTPYLVTHRTFCLSLL